MNYLAGFLGWSLVKITTKSLLYNTTTRRVNDGNKLTRSRQAIKLTTSTLSNNTQIHRDSFCEDE